MSTWCQPPFTDIADAAGAETEFVINEFSSSASSSVRLSQRSCSDTASLSRQEAGSFCQRDSHACITNDGWRLHIQHVYDPLAEASSGYADTVRQHPVLLVPGLASSAEHTFDLLPECSLVELLVSRGHDVWLADLRGELVLLQASPITSQGTQ